MARDLWFVNEKMRFVEMINTVVTIGMLASAEITVFALRCAEVRGV